MSGNKGATENLRTSQCSTFQRVWEKLFGRKNACEPEIRENIGSDRPGFNQIVSNGRSMYIANTAVFKNNKFTDE